MDFEPNEHAADGVTAGQARHNSNNVGSVTAGHMGHNSSHNNNELQLCRLYYNNYTDITVYSNFIMN